MLIRRSCVEDKFRRGLSRRKPTARPKVDFSALNQAGLNRQAVLNVADLPAEMQASLHAEFDLDQYRQIILIAHAGRRLWEVLAHAGLEHEEHPIDVFSQQHALAWFARQFPDQRAELLYPGDRPIGLQALGTLAGWHHRSPMMIGIDAHWGTWFAYRVALLTTTDLPVTPPDNAPHPCASCADAVCRRTCPADALSAEGFQLSRCIAERTREHSPCADRCVARLACPVGSEHRYELAQIQHSYTRSLRMIREYF